MLGVPKCSWGWTYTNVTARTTPGAVITPGTSSEGAWYDLVHYSDVVADVYMVRLWVCAGNTTGTIRNIVIDLGVDQAGGGSYTAVISNILCSQASNAVDGGIWMTFPLFIKSGSSIGVRAQSSNTSTVRCNVYLYGNPSNPAAIATGQYSETLGVSGVVGTSITPGNSNAWGSWTSLGTTTQRCWHWNVFGGFANTTTTALMYQMELAVGNGTSYNTIITRKPLFLPGNTERTGMPDISGVWEVPAGATLYARATCSGTTVTGFSAVAIGIGG